ncbi:hypothetical protein ACWGJP_11555 [Microbacterium sp. NPDC055903]
MDDRRRTLVSWSVLGMLLLTGCVGQGADEGGFGLPELDAHDAAEVFVDAGVEPVPVAGGIVTLDNGCHTWSGQGSADGAWVVWPSDVGLDPEAGGAAVLADGTVVDEETVLSGAGALIELEQLPGGGNPDSYFSSFGSFCDAGERGVLVLAEVSA